jgi:hypothetical protein
MLLVLLLATGPALAEDAPKAKPDAAAAKAQEQKTKVDEKALGMSVLGNQEAPKALVIVPWKSSELGASAGISTMLDDSRLPIDKEVFMRLLSYYEVSSTTTRHDGAPAGGRDSATAAKPDAAQPATAAHRR